VRTAVKRSATHERSRLARYADLKQHLPFRGEFAHGMVTVIGAINGAVMTDGTRGAGKRSPLPMSVGIGLANPIRSSDVRPIEHEYLVFVVNGNRGGPSWRVKSYGNSPQ